MWWFLPLSYSLFLCFRLLLLLSYVSLSHACSLFALCLIGKFPSILSFSFSLSLLLLHSSHSLLCTYSGATSRHTAVHSTWHNEQRCFSLVISLSFSSPSLSYALLVAPSSLFVPPWVYRISWQQPHPPGPCCNPLSYLMVLQDFLLFFYLCSWFTLFALASSYLSVYRETSLHTAASSTWPMVNQLSPTWAWCCRIS